MNIYRNLASYYFIKIPSNLKQVLIFIIYNYAGINLICRHKFKQWPIIYINKIANNNYIELVNISQNILFELNSIKYCMFTLLNNYHYELK